MSDTVIQVENLGKKYVLGQQQQGNSRYVALRDVVADGVKSVGRRLRHPLKSQPARHEEEFWALKDVSFEVKQGEVVGIIGRNGAGKSTLLKILSRITEPTEGRVRLRGRVASLLEVGTGFHPELTGRENIFLNGAILGMSRVEINRKFDEIVDFAEVERFLDTPVKRYSSGMYVRLAFAVAAHLEPEILVVDEVLAVGDAAFQKKCLGKLHNIANSEGRTVVFVSHDLPAVQSLCSRALLIEQGLIKIQANTDKVISAYLGMGRKRSSDKIDLLEHPGRLRSREKALKKIWLLDEMQRVKNEFKMGEGISVLFSFDCESSVSSPGFGFGFEDQSGRRVFSLNNYMCPSLHGNLKIVKKGVASLRINKLPLMPGRYSVSISLVENQTEWVDFIERAIEFEVFPADVFGSGKIPDRSHGIVFLPGEIEIEAN
ncbi:ABC transporter ATP-binding protein [Nodosilinea sp. E11]|uniref:ABC transporter ATP-binding protein n=1 Tax=Nodosilinea sp. E11 TaxID=3037479 RepID=UPI0029350DD1|nr:ABC transporter ATP-binding protein [Nodosilinea sp. E11]WOD40828.1 ABC transporter ATP-binding protein [Nodosilinea sp. E11]